MTHRRLTSFAIAGAWGYIGRKFLDAAKELNIPTSVYDVGAVPRDLELDATLIDTEEHFYQQSADLFHLALHPEHRVTGMKALLGRDAQASTWILCEKPMATPESPRGCELTQRSIEQSPAVVLYDFPELFDPITRRIVEFLRGGENVVIESIRLQRSKDREDPAIARNTKRMVHIQYQETVHCLAFALSLLAQVQGKLMTVFEDGLSISARSRPYTPPNPAAYPYVVDGRCEYEMTAGNAQIQGLTDFTRGAPWSKRREIRGRMDGRAFLIEADFLEGEKWLMINGQPQEAVNTNSYVEVLETIGQLRRAVSREEVMSGIYPHVEFARITYQLSALAWRSCWDQEVKSVGSLSQLLGFDAEFAEAVACFSQY